MAPCALYRKVKDQLPTTDVPNSSISHPYHETGRPNDPYSQDWGVVAHVAPIRRHVEFLQATMAIGSSLVHLQNRGVRAFQAWEAWM